MTKHRTPYNVDPLAAAKELARASSRLQQEINAAGYGPRDYKAELDKTKQRLADLETAAREVCQTHKIVIFDPGTPLPPHTKAMRALANLIDFPGWWQL